MGDSPKKVLKFLVYGGLTLIAYIFPSFFIRGGTHTTRGSTTTSIGGAPYAYADAPAAGDGSTPSDGDDDDGGGADAGGDAGK